MCSKQEKFKNLYHYTSYRTLGKILDVNVIREEYKMNFLFGSPILVNDKHEGRLFLKYMFSEDSNYEKLLSYYNQALNNVFILCMIRHRSYSKYHINSIPMWKMYGDNLKGFRMTFDYEKLKVFCQQNGFKLLPVQYVTKKEMEEIAQKKYLENKKKLDNYLNDESLRTEIVTEALLYKTKLWQYENEYRMIVIGNDSQVKIIKGKRKYPVRIPIECLKEIMIGPNAESKKSKRKTLGKIKSMIGIADCFKIRESQIQINNE